METPKRVSLARSDFVGFDWIVDMQGMLEWLLDKIECDPTDPRQRSAKAKHQ